MSLRAWRLAPLLFGSGACALVYQVGWFREFRLIFGASTAASSAVLAVFIGGLGLGGLWWGARADRHPRPLLLYAKLEAAIAVSAALSPALLWLVRQAYLLVGGTSTLGLVGGTVSRLVLVTLVLAIPTVLMGGTLPAVVRAAQGDDDPGRHSVGVLYGVNTLGSVLGAFASSFVLLEVLGTRATLWSAALVNALVAVTARMVERRWVLPGATPAAAEAPPLPAPGGRPGPLVARFLVAASALVGFAFFLMEMVWYRMLGPLLGGTVFTFGLILSLALLGIGAGGALYGRRTQQAPSLGGLALTCLLEAVAVAAPFALGDRLAVTALLLRPLGAFGFWGHVAGWAAVAALVVVPAAFAAGYQFPLLISLMGRGREAVGRQLGLLYAWNTAGAMAGALAGGFGLLTALTAPGCWKLVAALLALLGVTAAALAAGEERGRWRVAVAGALAVAVAGLVTADGPTAAWRHSAIGAGRVDPSAVSSPNAMEDFLHRQRRTTVWEAEGIESSVAINATASLSLFVNGKSDGNVKNDASTMIMGGLLGALLHPGEPRRALVIGLGTGASAGWLAEVPTMERVDVVELEGSIAEVAERCAPISRWRRGKPRTTLTINDAREVILTTRETYDVIMSEPSNPFRAGVASLFTGEYYQAVAARLAGGGLFAQWIQAYEVDAPTILTVLATVASVFPEVEIWQVGLGDLILLAGKGPRTYHVGRLAERLRREPYRSALAYTWRVADVEGVLAHHLARGGMARTALDLGGELNTDDRTTIEFGFARGLVGQLTFGARDILAAAQARGEDRAAVTGGEVDWSRVDDERMLFHTFLGYTDGLSRLSDLQRKNARPHLLALGGDPAGAAAALRALGREPRGLAETSFAAEILAGAGDEAALPHLERLRELFPTDADALTAILRFRQGKPEEALPPLLSTYHRLRQDPWPSLRQITQTFPLARQLAAARPEHAPRILEALEQPFVVALANETRLDQFLTIAIQLRSEAYCQRAVAPYEPHVPWREAFLAYRAECYRTASSPLREAAEADLLRFRRQGPVSFAAALGPK